MTDLKKGRRDIEFLPLVKGGIRGISKRRRDTHHLIMSRMAGAPACRQAGRDYFVTSSHKKKMPFDKLRVIRLLFYHLRKTLRSQTMSEFRYVETSRLAGAEGFEPPNARTKTWCLTTWRRPIDRRDCNSLESKIKFCSILKGCVDFSLFLF